VGLGNQPHHLPFFQAIEIRALAAGTRALLGSPSHPAPPGAGLTRCSNNCDS
jgi:hypothetical protein